MAFPHVWRQPLLGVGAVAAHLAASRRQVQVDCREVPAWEALKRNLTLGCYNPERAHQQQEKITEFRKQQEATKAASNDRLRELEIDNARKGVENAMLRKIIERQDRESCEKDAKMQKLQSQARLGSSRLQKVLSSSKSRHSEIAWSLIQAAPGMGRFSALLMASFIDGFEDFEHPEVLRSEVTEGGVLRIFTGAPSQGQADKWRLNYSTLKELKTTEQEQLVASVNQQIAKQKKLFEVRRIVQKICETHLLECFAIDQQPMSADQLRHHLKSVPPSGLVGECDRLADCICNRLSCVFHDLEKANFDVEGFLVAGWQPLALQHALWAFGYLQNVRTQGLLASQEVPVEARQEVGLSLYDTWKQMMTSPVATVAE